MVKDIAFTAYPAKDVSRLRKFYTNALGIRFDEPLVQDGVEKYAQGQVGSGWFAVITTEWQEVAPSGGLAFEVEKIEDTVQQVRGAGVDVSEEPYETPVCRILSFSDPEGNKVTLHQTTTPH